MGVRGLNRFGYVVAGCAVLAIGGLLTGLTEYAIVSGGVGTATLWWAMRRNETETDDPSGSRGRDSDDDGLEQRQTEIEGLKGRGDM